MSDSETMFTVKRAGTGLGLFATTPIKREQRLIEYIGERISNAEADAKGGKYLFRINSRRVIDGAARTNTARYINHSCRPNAEAFTDKSRVWIWSKRKIAAGEEITIDYGKEYFDQHIAPVGCQCAHCRERASIKLSGSDKT